MNTEEIVEKYTPLVNRIAKKVIRNKPRSVQVDDLRQSGFVGLLSCYENYDEAKGATRETYYGIRIRGAMLDSLRQGDWVPRSVYRKERAIDAATKVLGENATAEEIAAEAGLSDGQYRAANLDTRNTRASSFEEQVNTQGESTIPSQSAGPVEILLHSELWDLIKKCVGKLTPRQQLVFNLCNSKELNLKSIGKILGVSESRVSQIYTFIKAQLKSDMAHYAH